MEKKVVYSIIAFCLLMLSSCLGDPATSLTLANQAGVVGTEPLKVVYVKGGDVVSSEDFQKATVDDGECILFDYSIDMGLAPNTDEGLTYKTATIYQNTITEVPQWPMSGTLTDTVTPTKKELPLSVVQTRFAFIRNKLFLFTEMSNHGTAQLDSFSLSYNPGQQLGDKKVYDLYLKTILLEADNTSPGKSMIIPCAFDIKDFVQSAATTQDGGMEQIKFRINYISGFNKDTTAYVWKNTEEYTIEKQVK